MDSIIIEMTGIGTFAIAAFGAVFCLMQTQFSHLRKSFAIFLVAIAVNNLPEAFSQLIAILPRAYTPALSFVTWPSSFLLAPLFWIYVIVLTSQDQNWPPKLSRHFIFPAATVVIALLVLACPPEVQEALYSGMGDIQAPWPMTLMFLLALCQFAIFPQIAIYLYLTLRRLLRFRLWLRDFYSSTEQYEQRWIFVISGLAILFWLAQVLLLMISVRPEGGPSAVIIASLVGFALVAALTLWGLRQTPPLGPNVGDRATPSEEQKTGKYEKSALNLEASERLSRKLRVAMEVDHLHRDPNLSLWALAKHTGASPNYISQTLNEKIGESFFDFVNGYRIAEAKTLLSTTNESVLNITYDVGFNARSSFYNAFKRVTGQTPTSYRKMMSQRVGLDDMNGPLGDC